MMTKGFLSHQKGVMDTGEKMGLIESDGGVKMVKLGSKGLGNELVLAQNSVMDTGEKMGLVAGDGGVKMVTLGS